MGTGIIHFRVDDRMLHGIVATQWVPTSRATRAMVVDDPASTNDVVRASLKMACPPGVALSVIGCDKAITNIQAGKYANQRVFWSFATSIAPTSCLRRAFPCRSSTWGT